MNFCSQKFYALQGLSWASLTEETTKKYLQIESIVPAIAAITYADELLNNELILIKVTRAATILFNHWFC
jgi:hypothetical protein